MEWRLLARQPWKLLAVALFWFVLASASLLLALNCCVDALNLRCIEEYYASVGTVLWEAPQREALAQDRSQLSVISEEAVHILEASKQVDKIQIQKIRSASIQGMPNLSSLFFMRDASTLAILEGTVALDTFYNEKENDIPSNGILALENVTVHHSHPDWAGERANWDWTVVNYQMRAGEESPFQVGNRYLLMGYIRLSYQTGLTRDELCVGWKVNAPFVQQDAYYTDVLYPHAIVPLPADASKEDVDEILRELGWDAYLNQTELLSTVYTARIVSDMGLLMPSAEDCLLYTEGRGIRPDDAGKRVCVISHELAQKRELQVGDKLPIALADDAYDVVGFRKGVPMLGKLLTLPYESAQEYEIIGTFHQENYEPFKNAFQFSYNDIFIPVAVNEPIAVDEAYPYTLSFRVRGEDTDAFLDETAPKLESLGYSVRLFSSKWSGVESIYKTIRERQTGMVLASVAAMLAGCWIYTLLMSKLYLREFALRRLLGTPNRPSRRAYSIPFTLAGMIGSTGSVALVFFCYTKLFKAEMARIAGSHAPSDSWMLLFLIVMVLAQLLLAYAGLRLWVRHSQTHTLRALLK